MGTQYLSTVPEMATKKKNCLNNRNMKERRAEGSEELCPRKAFGAEVPFSA